MFYFCYLTVFIFKIFSSLKISIMNSWGLTVPSLGELSLQKQLNIRKPENIHSKEGTQVSLYSFLRNRGGLVGGIKRTTACYEVSHNSRPLVILKQFLLSS